MKEKSVANNGDASDLSAEITALKAEVELLKLVTSKPGSYNGVIQAIKEAANHVLSTQPFSDIFYERVREMHVSSSDLVTLTSRAARTASDAYIRSEDAREMITSVIASHPAIQSIVNGQIAAILQRPDFIAALVAAFRETLSSTPAHFNALVESLAKDEKGQLSQALTRSDEFVEKQVQILLTHMRDKLLAE